MLRLLTVLGFIFGLILTCSAQQEEMKVYETKNGVRSTMPSKLIVRDGNTTKVYTYENGVRKILPEKVYKEQPSNTNRSTIKEYRVRNTGIREVQPTRVIKRTNNNKKSSSGNWW